MTREEALKDLVGYLTYDIPPDDNAIRIAIDALKREPRWIPISERLPKENKTVIVSTVYRVYPEARYTKKYGWQWAFESGADYWQEIIPTVTAWMPLPEMYRAEREVES